MILTVDVCYRGDRACAAGVAFDSFRDEAPTAIYQTVSTVSSPYIPGEFYRRELPPILQLIGENGLTPTCIVIDGYVFLDGKSRQGLGYYLYEHFDGRIPVIGVAKSRFKTVPDGYEIYRGGSRRPLYVTSAGIDLSAAKEAIASMAGRDRLPKLLKLADRTARECCEGL